MITEDWSNKADFFYSVLENSGFKVYKTSKLLFYIAVIFHNITIFNVFLIT